MTSLLIIIIVLMNVFYHLPSIFFKVMNCPAGFIGSYCENRCSFPRFGYGCQQVCLCSRKQCNSTTGCQLKQIGKISCGMEFTNQYVNWFTIVYFYYFFFYFIYIYNIGISISIGFHSVNKCFIFHTYFSGTWHEQAYLSKILYLKNSHQVCSYLEFHSYWKTNRNSYRFSHIFLLH